MNMTDKLIFVGAAMIIAGLVIVLVARIFSRDEDKKDKPEKPEKENEI